MHSLNEQQPVFLVGSERSGTTVLRLMLDHHPQITWQNEFEFAIDLIPETEGWPALDSYYDWLSTNRVFLSSGFTIDRGLDYPALVRSFLSQRLERHGKQIVGASVHRHYDRLLRLWPDARFIHLIRDGRDVARSVMAMGWAGNAWAAALWWLEAERLLEKLEAIVPEHRRIALKYENLITEPVEELIKVCRFIGVQYDPVMLDYRKDTTYEAPDPRLIYQWERKASDEEVGLLEARMGDLLRARGYDLSGLPPIQVTPAMERRFSRQDRIERLKFRLRRYGWWLVAQDFFSRRLGLRWWQKRVRIRLNAVDQAHLK